MGVMLSILVACVGVIELLTCLKQVSNVGKSVVAPCLSYHDPLIENPSFHDSLCGISHSHDLSLPRSVRNKLENLHAYSLRVRSELKSHGFADGSTLSEFSSQDVFDGVSRADSRLSLDFDLVAQDAEEQWNSSERANVDIKIDRAGDEVDAEVLQLYLDAEKSSEYIRIPTPIPLALSQELSRSNSSIDVSVTFEQDSGNELPTRDSFERIPGVVRDGESRRSQSPEQCLPVDLGSSDCQVGEIVGNKRGSSGRKALKSTSVLRKATRLKSKNAEVSKSAENLSSRRKRHREPERRKSEISIQTSGTSRDEWTNTSPTDSERSISASRSSVSVQVQTNSASDEDSPFKWVLSESKRDTARSSRKAFVNKRVLKSKSLDDYCTSNDIDCTSSRFDRARNGWRTSRANEEDEIDEEFLDAEDQSSSQSGPIEYCIPSVEAGKAFWLIFSGEYTKAMNKDWHSGHFCCWQCDESLTGQRYVLRDEHPYCIKCYESVFANGCEECNKIIGIDSKDLSYKDKHWHEACFLCNKCRVSLVDKQFGSKVDKIYCGNCYDAQFASRCDGCGEIFRAGMFPLLILFLYFQRQFLS